MTVMIRVFCRFLPGWFRLVPDLWCGWVGELGGIVGLCRRFCCVLLLLCASTDGRVLAAGGAPAGVPEFGVPSTGARANAGSASGFDASVMHPLVWDENSFVPRVLGVAGSSMPSVGSLVPGAGSGAGLLDPYGWDSLGVAAPAVPSAQGAGGAPVLPDSLVGVSAASGVVLGSSGFEVLGARVVDSRGLALRRLILWLRRWALVGVLTRSRWWAVTRFPLGSVGFVAGVGGGLR